MAKVLIVEDEPEIRGLLTIRAQREGHVVTAVESAEDAVREIHSKDFEIALVDWMLPGASGIEFIKILRQKFGKRTAVLMLTAKDGPASVIEGLMAGADDYLAKPFDQQVLATRMRALLHRQSGVKAT